MDQIEQFDINCIQTNDLIYVELFEIELFDHLTVQTNDNTEYSVYYVDSIICYFHLPGYSLDKSINFGCSSFQYFSTIFQVFVYACVKTFKAQTKIIENIHLYRSSFWRIKETQENEMPRVLNCWLNIWNSTIPVHCLLH